MLDKPADGDLNRAELQRRYTAVAAQIQTLERQAEDLGRDLRRARGRLTVLGLLLDSDLG
jgi:hypothetical protein